MAKAMSSSRTPKAIIKELEALSRARLTTGDATQFMAELYAEKHERGSTILFAAHVDTALESALIRNLDPISETTRFELFGRGGGLLRDFGAKIMLGYAMHIFGEETKQNLDLIRAIRNAFGHASTPISFANTPIAEACAALVIPATFMGSFFPAGPKEVALEGRARFQKVCEITASNLTGHNFRRTIPLERPEGLSGSLVPPSYEIVARQAPLP